MFITLSIGMVPCGPVANCTGPFGPWYRLAASMNNESFVLPSTLSMLEAFHYGVLKDTTLGAAENHPMHFHGFDFYVLAQGFGNYDPVNDPKKFNLVNPQKRNTIAVPIGGWAVIRFRADNPGETQAPKFPLF
ncbi:Laccase [Thalictrum thalictroides]|uniref:Laccase n=1 Tax=Thalictrum thalictroides TaxID=46969 RepID=A0A7J6W6J4_THATH|nr:Laccase [Thalictrum thalictroides]